MVRHTPPLKETPEQGTVFPELRQIGLVSTVSWEENSCRIRFDNYWSPPSSCALFR